jgi:Protein of unknown function (DUF3102)
MTMAEPTKLQVVEPGLPELAQRIKAAHAGVLDAARNVVAKAISAGHLLKEAKAKLPHGQFLPWLSEHCELSERTAHRYMQLATNARRIEAALNGKSATMATLSLNKAMRLIESKPDADGGLAAASKYARTQETLINTLEELLPEDVDEAAQTTIAELEKAVAKRKTN